MFDTHHPPYEHEIRAFGDAWCGPELYESHKENLVARYESPDTSDGQTVEIFCTPFPARCYTIRVLAGKNSIGDHHAAYELRTGSSMAELAAEIGKAIADGMLGLRENASVSGTH